MFGLAERRYYLYNLPIQNKNKRKKERKEMKSYKIEQRGNLNKYFNLVMVKDDGSEMLLNTSKDLRYINKMLKKQEKNDELIKMGKIKIGR